MNWTTATLTIDICWNNKYRNRMVASNGVVRPNHTFNTHSRNVKWKLAQSGTAKIRRRSFSRPAANHPHLTTICCFCRCFLTHTQSTFLIIVSLSLSFPHSCFLCLHFTPKPEPKPIQPLSSHSLSHVSLSLADCFSVVCVHFFVRISKKANFLPPVRAYFTGIRTDSCCCDQLTVGK